MLDGKFVGTGRGTGEVEVFGTITLGSATLGSEFLRDRLGASDGILLGRFHDTCLTTGGAKRVAMGSVGTGMVLGVVTLAKMSASWCRAWRWLSAIGAKGDSPGYPTNALMRSWAAAVAAAAGDAAGMEK